MSDEVKTQETPENGKELNDRQKAFCREYVKDFRGTDSAIRAGYTENRDAAGAHAARLLADVRIRSEIDRILHNESEAQRQEIIAENLRIWRQMSMDMDIRPNDRLKATELLGKYAAMFTDNVNLAGRVETGPIVDTSNLSESTKAELALAYARNLDKH